MRRRRRSPRSTGAPSRRRKRAIQPCTLHLKRTMTSGAVNVFVICGALHRLALIELLVGHRHRVHVVQRVVAVHDVDRLADAHARRRAASTGSPADPARPRRSARRTSTPGSRPSFTYTNTFCDRRRWRRRSRPRLATEAADSAHVGIGVHPDHLGRGGGVPVNTTLPDTLPAVAASTACRAWPSPPAARRPCRRTRRRGRTTRGRGTRRFGGAE